MSSARAGPPFPPRLESPHEAFVEQKRHVLDPHLILSEWASLPADARRGNPAREAVSGGAFSPRNLLAPDLNGDGLADLVALYADSGQGVLAVWRGTDEHRLFDAVADRFYFDTAPDLAVSGDFNRDGFIDLIVARQGGERFYLLAGNPAGVPASVEAFAPGGAITALAAGDINRSDGVIDLMVAVSSGDGPRLVVYESPAGALAVAPEVISLPAPASALATGVLDGDFYRDVAIACGSDLVILSGRDRQLNRPVEKREGPTAPSLAAFALPYLIEGLAVGDFLEDSRDELAVLGADAAVHVIDVRSRGREAARVALPPGGSTGAHPSMMATRLSSLPKDELVISNEVDSSLTIVMAEGNFTRGSRSPETRRVLVAGKTAPPEQAEAGQESGGGFRTTGLQALTLPLSGAPRALVPMRLNGDALYDLVLLNRNDAGLTLIATGVAATHTVNDSGNESDGDTDDGICDTGNADDGFTGICTLNAAMQQANASPGADTIRFNIGSGVVHISPASFVATEAVTIDGTTQPGYDGSPLVVLDHTLYIHGGNSVVRGVVVNNDFHGIQLSDAGNNIVEKNYLGTDETGLNPFGNSECGVGVFSDDNVIGGATVAARNLLSGNEAAGVCLSGDNNWVGNNLIGLGIDGQTAVGNLVGVVISQDLHDDDIGESNIIGDSGAPNIISGNEQEGVQIGYGASANRVQNNAIGWNMAGSDIVPNAAAGVWIYGIEGQLATTLSNTIGSPGLPNSIVGNSYGIAVFGPDIDATVLHGNTVGADGGAGNVQGGVLIYEAPNTSIGGSGTGDDIVAGNNVFGIFIAMESPDDIFLGNVDIHGNKGVGVVSVGAAFNMENTRLDDNPGGIIAVGDLSAEGIEVKRSALSTVCAGDDIAVRSALFQHNMLGNIYLASQGITIEDNTILSHRLFGMMAMAPNVTIRRTTVDDSGLFGVVALGDDLYLESVTADSCDGFGLITLGGSVGMTGARARYNRLGLLAFAETNVSILGADFVGNRTFAGAAIGGTQVNINGTDVNQNFIGGMVGLGNLVSAHNVGTWQNRGPSLMAIGKSLFLTEAELNLNDYGAFYLYTDDITVEDVDIHDNNQWGLWALGRPSAISLNNLNVHDNGGNGIMWRGDFQATNVYVDNNGNTGIVLHKSDAAIASGRICENGKWGISGVRSTLDLTDVEIDDCGNVKGGVRLFLQPRH